MIKIDGRAESSSETVTTRGKGARNESLFDTFVLSLGPHVEAGDKRTQAGFQSWESDIYL